MHTFSFSLGLTALLAAATSSAQETVAPPAAKAVQEGQQEAPKPQGTQDRVERCLRTLSKLAQFEYRVKSSGSSNNPFARIIAAGAGGAFQGGNAKKEDLGTLVKRKDDLLLWSRDEGQQVLARHGHRWVALQSDGSWLPSRLPTSHPWKSQFLPEPGFLAERLLAILGESKWERLNVASLDGRPVRCYRVLLEGEVAGHLLDTGALSASSSGNPFGRVVMMVQGAGARFQKPKNETKIEVVLYEHPGSRIPLKIEANFWSKAPGNMGVVIQGPGMGQQDDEDEEKEEEGPDGKMRKKPTGWCRFELINSKGVETPELNDEAQKSLGVKREGV